MLVIASIICTNCFTGCVRVIFIVYDLLINDSRDVNILYILKEIDFLLL